MNMRALAAALAAGALVACLGAAEARAAAVCSNTVGAADWIYCVATGPADIDRDLANPAISTTGGTTEGIQAIHAGTGSIDIDVTGGSIAAAEAIAISLSHSLSGAIAIDLRNVAVSAGNGSGDHGIRALLSGSGGTGIDIDMTGGSIMARGATAHGVFASVTAATAASIDVDLTNVAVSTTGATAYGVYGLIDAVASTSSASVAIDVTGGSVSTTGATAYGVFGYIQHSTSAAALSIDVERVIVSTAGASAYGIRGDHQGAGGIDIDFAGSSIATTNSSAAGVFGRHTGAGGIDIDVTGGSIATSGASAHGVEGSHTGAGGIDIDVTGGSIATSGAAAHGVYGHVSSGFTSTGTISIDAEGGAVAAEGGAETRGMFGLHVGRGSIGMETGAAAEIEAPFAIGMEAKATNNANATGRLTIAHAGAVEALDAGIVAWAARSSGHTRGSGLVTANDAARTEPMIHVTSSGTVAVGESAMDAFIRERIAGADETLSSGEEDVLDAIVAEDSDALDTALAALDDDDYDAAWKAAARSLLTKRAAAPTSDPALAYRAAEEILGFPRAGVIATTHNYLAAASFIRNSDALSAAERRVLEAVLTGSGLEAALTALPASYTTGWKNNVRTQASNYNAGDIRVDVTGGSITAGGNGVVARYAVPHADNGAIAVTVAAGASVTGGANGVFVRGASAHTVTVNGAVTGGTGAGVHMAGGGMLTVGADGEVGATSGVGALADGGGDLTASVSGTVTGDIRVDGGGDLTANVMAGGVVTGTIHDPQTPFTVADEVSIGRILYSAGGTVTVSGGGKLTGVEGKAVESAAGALTVTVNDEGRVEGDILSGGTLTANIMAGGVVTGTLRNPQTPLTVAGSVGRILYDNGGTVTVSGGGKLTGVEGKAVESTAGALAVTVDDEGRVEGDILSGGTLTANVMAGGVVTGTLRNPQTPLTVAGSVARILYDNGGTVTVAGGGAVTGVDNEGTTEAIRADAGNLDVTVAANGEVTGLVEGRGDGNLDVTVSGEITGNIVERGAGDLDVAVSGTVTGGVVGEGAGAHIVAVEAAGAVTGTVRLPASAAVTISSARGVGRVHYDNGGAVTVNASGKITGLEIEGVREAIRSDAGDLAVTVHGMVTGNIEARGDGDLTVTVSETGTVTGEIFGRGGGTHTIEIAEKAKVLGTVHNPKSGTTVHGVAGRVLFDNGGALTVAATGSIAGVGGEAIRADAGVLEVTVAKGGMVTGRIEGRGAGAMTVTVSGAVTGAIHGKGAGKHEVTVASGGMVTGDIVDMEAGGLVASVAGRLEGSIEERGAGDLTATVTGTVTGGIRGMGAGSHTVSVQEGGAVAGAVHLPSGAITVAGRVGQALYDNGGTVTVAGGGRLTGVEGKAIESTAGALTVTVNDEGRVEGDILSGGTLTANIMAGGVVTGTLRNPQTPLTVAGRVGRILYDNGGSVTVAGGGAITGVEEDGAPEAIRSAAGDLTVDVAAMATVTGAIRGEGDGDLDVDVSGTVKGGIFGLGGGEHDVHVKSGGAVEGLIHLAASAVTVDGSAASVRFDRGGTVAVGAEGRISGLDGRAVHSAAGDLTVEVNGVVTGSVSDTGAGNLEVTVANALTGDVIGGGGGVHRLTVLSGGVFTGNVEGVEFIRIAGDAAGTLRVPEGNEVSVPAGGELVGAEDAQGRRVAIVAEMGALRLTVDGRVEGAVDATDAAAASMVTIGPDGVIDGKVTLAGAGSVAVVDGVAQSVDVPRGMVTVGENGRIEDGVPDAVELTVKAAEGETDAAVAERIGRVGTGVEVTLRRAGEEDVVIETDEKGLVLEKDEEGRLVLAPLPSGPAPRHRVYEALPSMLLALNALPAHGDRLASAGAPRGAFARFDAGSGERRPASSTAASRHEYRRLGFEAGLEGAVGESGLFAFSMHHVRGRADVETEGGRVDVSGTGARLSGAWLPGQDFYVSGQAAATLYEADLDSALDGALASDISGHGYAVGAEVGRRLDLGRVALTPRAGAAWSEVDMSSFTDSMDEQVSLDAGRRITARAGLRADAAAVPGGAGGVFATVDVERELSGAMETMAADTPLEAEAEATWLRLGLGGAHEWADGRFALRAAANYAAARNGNRDFAGNASLTVRF